VTSTPAPVTSPGEKLLEALGRRDPGYDGLRRASRAAIAIPLAALVSFLVAGNSQAPVFTLVGSIALLIVTDFPGTVGSRALGYLGLGINGVVLIAVGTWVAPHPLLAVPLCFAVGAVVSFLGLLSEIVAAGQRATLMVFLLPLCTPPGPVHDRLLGWLLALLICIPAALFIFPPRYSTALRDLAAVVCVALADRIEGASAPADMDAAMTALRTEFLGSAFRPVALSAGSRGLIRVVSNLQWLCDHVDGNTAALLGSIRDNSVAVLRGSARVLINGDAAGAAALTGVVAEHRATAFTQYANDIGDILDEPDDAAALTRGRELLSRRTMSATIGLTGSIIATATAIDARPLIDRLLGRGLPETGIADRVHSKRTALAALFGYLRTRSITVLNSLRTGLALSLAFVVTLILPVQNGLWVVLGALAVLRTSASTTRTTAVRAVAGTVIGFLAGAALIAVVGVNPVVLWSLLPVVTFGSTYVMRVGSFAASQAMFTMQVLIVFNLMRPTGWQIGLTRIEDVVLGALVGLVVSVLLWPGGAQSAVLRAFARAVDACSAYLWAAVAAVTRGRNAVTDAAVAETGGEALTAARTHGDAIRVYLSETNGTIDPGLLDIANRIPRLRTAADLIADIVPPPARTYPQTRKVLEDHTAALCARMRGDDGGPTADIGEEFVTTLRAEATFTGAAAAALPLVTAAANIGELELIYPAGI
jgi:hypothetical protein